MDGYERQERWRYHDVIKTKCDTNGDEAIWSRNWTSARRRDVPLGNQGREVYPFLPTQKKIMILPSKYSRMKRPLCFYMINYMSIKMNNRGGKTITAF